MRRSIAITILLATFGGLAISAPRQGKSNGRGHAEESHAGNSSGSIFTEVEIRIIRGWFSDKSNLRSLPPGLAKKEALPPGLQKQLQRNGTLPPGLQKKIQPLPPALEARLPRLPDGRRRVILAGTVILLDNKLGKILDLVSNVL